MFRNIWHDFHLNLSQKYWFREIFRKREENSTFTFLQEMKLGDREYYFRLD